MNLGRSSLKEGTHGKSSRAQCIVSGQQRRQFCAVRPQSAAERQRGSLADVTRNAVQTDRLGRFYVSDTMHMHRPVGKICIVSILSISGFAVVGFYKAWVFYLCDSPRIHPCLVLSIVLRGLTKYDRVN